MVQEELAARYGVSRIPLREALRTLESEGLVVMEHNRGAICRPLDGPDLADLYQLRAALEHTATRIAAERRVDLREPTALKRRQAESAIERGDLRALIDLDAEFHRSIAVGTQNAHIVRALASYWPLIMRAMHVYLSIERYRSEVWQEHTAIANAIAAGDVELAVVSMDAHILASRAKLLEEFSR
jgi:DNA-binding GntR family transcriptional regulator